MFSGQGKLQLFLVLIAFFSVPVMLLPKPLILKRRHEALMKAKVSDGDTAQRAAPPHGVRSSLVHGSVVECATTCGQGEAEFCVPRNSSCETSVQERCWSQTYLPHRASVELPKRVSFDPGLAGTPTSQHQTRAQ